MSITLTVTAGPHTGRTFRFDRHDIFLVGRSAEAHFSLPDDPFFSRMHFLIEINPPQCRLTDLNSHNGTLVNGQKVQAVELRDGDEIRGGRTTLRVSAPNAATLDLPAEASRPQQPIHPATLDDTLLRQRQPAPGAAPATSSPNPKAGLSTAPQVRATSGPDFPLVPGYRLVQELGKGGMGVVYRGLCTADGSEVAVKMIRPGVSPSATAIARFLRETAILRELRHPNIVGFRAAGEANGLLWFAMDFVPGTDASRLMSAGPMTPTRAIGIVLPLLGALAHAHAKGFVHRDVKPANLLVNGSPGSESVWVADFGLARAYQDSALSGLTLSGSVGGTPHFMPPEQVTDFRNARPAADQYSAAATLYHLLTGRFVHEGTGTADLFRRVLLEDPVSLLTHQPKVPQGLADAVHRGLARRPEDRHADVSAFAAAIRPFA